MEIVSLKHEIHSSTFGMTEMTNAQLTLSGRNNDQTQERNLFSHCHVVIAKCLASCCRFELIVHVHFNHCVTFLCGIPVASHTYVIGLIQMSYANGLQHCIPHMYPLGTLFFNFIYMVLFQKISIPPPQRVLDFNPSSPLESYFS